MKFDTPLVFVNFIDQGHSIFVKSETYLITLTQQKSLIPEDYVSF